MDLSPDEKRARRRRGKQIGVVVATVVGLVAGWLWLAQHELDAQRADVLRWAATARIDATDLPGLIREVESGVDAEVIEFDPIAGSPDRVVLEIEARWQTRRIELQFDDGRLYLDSEEPTSRR